MDELYIAASQVIINWRLGEPGWVIVRWDDLLAIMKATIEVERSKCDAVPVRK